MDTSKPTPEELAAEQDALAEKKEDDIRSKIITEYGFDEVDDKERIDKLVAKDLEHSKKLYAAVGAKIKWRNEANNKPKDATPPKDEKNNVQFDPALMQKTVNEAISASNEARDLEGMDYTDEIKSEIKRVAKITNVSVRQAARDPYIVSKFIEPWEKENRKGEATISRTNRSGGTEQTTDAPPKVDMNTEEGRAKYDKWKAEMIKKGY